jgi:hypothetical protein
MPAWSAEFRFAGLGHRYRLCAAHGNESMVTVQPSILADIKQTGNFAFKAGNVRIKAVNGQTGSVMAALLKLMLHKVLADGTDVYVSSTNTDQSGLADFALPDLGNAQAYVFKARKQF